MSKAISDIGVKRLSGNLGAEVTGLDLSENGNNEAFSTIHKVFLASFGLGVQEPVAEA